MSLNTSTLRPGLLVSLKTSVTGNVAYAKRTIEREHTDANGTEVAQWETTRTISDKAEHEAAQTARGAAGHAIRKVCTNSAFGLLCPEDKAEALDKAIVDARAICDEFNAMAKLTRLHVYVITGRVAADDVEAVKAINSEIRELMADMQEGLSNLDVKTVRAAASKAKQIGQMLAPDAAARIQMAVDLARESAKKIVAAGEQVAAEVDTVTIKRIAEQRTAFLDLDDAKEVARPAAVGRSVDFDKYYSAENMNEMFPPSPVKE